MNERIDHANEAMAGLIGADQFLSEEMPSQIGEHKADMLAVAQVHATLALVEQQRIANLIALGHAEGGPYRYLDEGKKSLRARDAFDVAATLLGIEVDTDE